MNTQHPVNYTRQVWDRDEFLRQCSAVPHGVSANTWARVMWLISNGEASEPAAMAAFSLCAAVRAKEVRVCCHMLSPMVSDSFYVE